MATLAEKLADQLLRDVVENRLPAHGLLPPEPDLAERFGVSRMTVREAVQILRAKNIVRIRRGLGTEVNPPERWTSLAAAMLMSASNEGDEVRVAERLLEARRMIEAGAAQLAAERRTDQDLAELTRCLDEMVAAMQSDDVDTIAETDLRFHALILQSAHNVFLPLLFESFGPLLLSIRRRTSTMPEVRQEALAHHRRIFDAIKARDVEGARAAMELHLSPEAARAMPTGGE